jgi:CubicO group peptidase (beta-lactamase class C family)
MSDKATLSKITDQKFKELCEALLGEMKRVKIPGATIGVWQGGQEHIAGFGKTSVEHPLPVAPETLFQIGSVTKPMLATAVMRLVEMGKLDLDVPVKTYLPKLNLKDKDVEAKVTVRQLLNHTAGWEGDYFNDFGTGDDALETIVNLLGDLNQMTPLGEIWSYNNAAFYIAGRVIEVITGKSFETAIKELIFEPLKMQMSFFYPDDILITHRFVVGHDLIEKKNKVSRPWAIPRASAPAGGVVSNAHDMLTFARFHMGNGDGIMKPSSIKAMQKPVVTTSGVGKMGISWFVTEMGGMKVISHGGATNGQTCGFWIIPEKKFAFVLLTNSDESRTDRIFNEALKIYFDVSIPPVELLELPTDDLQMLTGKYENIEMILVISQKNGELWLEYEHKGGFPTPDSPPLPVPPPMRIGVYETDKIITLDEPLKDRRGEFLRASDGTLTWFRYGFRIHKKIG